MRFQPGPHLFLLPETPVFLRVLLRGERVKRLAPQHVQRIVAQVGYALGIAAFGSVFTGRLGRTMTGSGLFRDPVAAAAQASQGGVRALVAASPQHAAASHVVHAAYATGQNSVYLAAGIAAVAGGVLALAFIRTERPAGTAAVAPANQASAAGAVGH